MPLTLPLYFWVSNWWEVQPKLARGLFVGFWLVYYLPRVLVALVLAVLDNLVKGAAGQAVQAFNALLGLPEESGLEQLPLAP